MPNEILRIADFFLDVLGLTTQETSNLTNRARCLSLLPVVPSSHGNVHKWLRRIGSPNVGFRTEYKGKFFTKSTKESVTANLTILDFSWLIDQAVADIYPDSRGGRDQAISDEGFQHLVEAMFVAEKQFLNGQAGAGWTDYSSQGKAAGNADGFAGLADVYDTIANGAINGTAGGTGTDNRTSVYYLNLNSSGDECAAIMPETNPFMFGETVSQNVQIVNDPDADAQGPDGGTNYPAYYTPGYAWMGFMVGTAHAAKRRANIALNSTFDDDAIYDDLAAFPAGMGPTHAVMNRQSLNALRKSRTATNVTGAPAPTPQTVGDGSVEIVVTDAIGIDEAVVA